MPDPEPILTLYSPERAVFTALNADLRVDIGFTARRQLDALKLDPAPQPAVAVGFSPGLLRADVTLALSDGLGELRLATGSRFVVSTSRPAVAGADRTLDVAAALSNLRQREADLTELIGVLDAGTDLREDHWQQLLESVQLTEDAVLRVRQAQAVQNWWLGMGSMLLDLASVGDFVNNFEEWASSPANLGKVDGMYEFLKDFESFVGTAIGDPPEGTERGPTMFNDVFGLVPALDGAVDADGTMHDLQTLKSDLSDLLNMLQEIQEDLEAGNRGLPKFKTFGQLVGRTFKSWALIDQAARKVRRTKLEAVLDGSQGVLDPASTEFLFWNEQRFVARDALAETKAAIDDVESVVFRLAPELLATVTPVAPAIDALDPLGSLDRVVGEGLAISGEEAASALAPNLSTACDACSEFVAKVTVAQHVLASDMENLNAHRDLATALDRLAICCRVRCGDDGDTRRQSMIAGSVKAMGVLDGRIESTTAREADLAAAEFERDRLYAERSELDQRLWNIRDRRWEFSVFGGAGLLIRGDNKELRAAQAELRDMAGKLSRQDELVAGLRQEVSLLPELVRRRIALQERLTFLDSLAPAVATPASAASNSKAKPILAVAALIGLLLIGITAVRLASSDGEADVATPQVQLSPFGTGGLERISPPGTWRPAGIWDGYYQEATGLLAVTEDPVGGDTFSIRGTEGDELSSSQIDSLVAALVETSDGFRDQSVGNTSYPCGGVADDYRVTCPIGAGPIVDNEFFIITVNHAGDIATGATGAEFTYGLAFDDDGDDSDNYQFTAPYDADFFRNTEHWYRLIIRPDGTRHLFADGVRDGTPGIPRYSAALVVESGSTLTWMIPRSEVPGPKPAFRVSAFHDRDPDPSTPPDPATSGGDISGEFATDPLLSIDALDTVFDNTDLLPPDIEGTQARGTEVPTDPDAFIIEALLDESFGRLNTALASGDEDALFAELHPALVAANPVKCRQLLSDTIAQANEYRLDVAPEGAGTSTGIPLFVAQATIAYPNGDAPWVPAFLPGMDGRLYLLLQSCLT